MVRGLKVRRNKGSKHKKFKRPRTLRFKMGILDHKLNCFKGTHLYAAGMPGRGVKQ